MTQPDFRALVSRLRNLGHSLEQAEDIAVAIGDLPEIVGGEVIARREDGSELARVPFSAYDLQP
jgi:hypothetical protein